MSSTTDKAKGYANEVQMVAIPERLALPLVADMKKKEKILAANETIQEMLANGTAQTLTGEAQVGVGKVKDTVKSGARAADKALNK